MSQFYGMNVTIEGYKAKRKKAIIAAAQGVWSFDDDWNDYNGTLSNYGEDNLCAGKGEDGFTEELTHAIWKANGGFCEVRVQATYLEDLPHSEYSLDEDAYESTVKAGLLKTKKGE